MNLTAKEIREHLIENGHDDAIKSLDGLIRTKDAQNRRFNQHINRVHKFLELFLDTDTGISWSCDDFTLDFEGNYFKYRALANSLGVYYSEGQDYDGIEEARMSFPSELVLSWMHLWFNKYKDCSFDIYQSRLKLEPCENKGE